MWVHERKITYGLFFTEDLTAFWFVDIHLSSNTLLFLIGEGSLFLPANLWAPIGVVSMSLGFLFLCVGILFTIFGWFESSPRLRKVGIGLGLAMIIVGYILLKTIASYS